MPALDLLALRGPPRPTRGRLVPARRSVDELRKILQTHKPATNALAGLELAAPLADLVAQGLDSNAADARCVLQADQRGLTLSLKQLKGGGLHGGQSTVSVPAGSPSLR